MFNMYKLLIMLNMYKYLQGINNYAQQTNTEIKTSFIGHHVNG